ncbi:MAG: hypothetical protein RLZZ306_325 [Bacteroidota bacterium]
MPNKFLTAEWNNLIMANYVIDPEILKPYLPPKTELDFFNGVCYVSVIGFMFEKTKILGISFPFHVNFEEVNLRFYVRVKDGNSWKRGAVFIKEIVPKLAITLVANTLYREKYVTLPMRHFHNETENEINLGYHWKFKGVWNKLEATTEKETSPLIEGSKEQFIAEHYWGYAKYSEKTTFEYGVEHPSWLIHKVKSYKIECDFEKLYGKKFAFLNEIEADSVFMAKGSAISILHKKNL